MYLNSIKPAEGSRANRRRVGRGIGSGLGKTSGRGHKGQKSRAGGFHKTGFEGGQMPLQRRLPKRGFISLKKLQSENIRLSDLNNLKEEEINIQLLKQEGIISKTTQNIKVYLAGELTKRITLHNIPVTKGAKAAIEAAGGRIV